MEFAVSDKILPGSHVVFREESLYNFRICLATRLAGLELVRMQCSYLGLIVELVMYGFRHQYAR